MFKINLKNHSSTISHFDHFGTNQVVQLDIILSLAFKRSLILKGNFFAKNNSSIL